MKHRLLRLAAVTPAHFGAASGAATLDRPTEREAQHGLPFLPDSALKGVLAAPLPAGERKRLFGSSDEDDGQGSPGSVIFGNGEPLCFPVPSDRGPAWVFPALTLAWALRFDPAAEQAEAVAAGLLALIEGLQGPPRALAWPFLPRLDVPVEVAPLQEIADDRGAALDGWARHYAGAALPPDAPLLVVAARNAGALWPAVAERRTLVALDSETRTVAGGALRQVELVPAGSVFLSLLSGPDGVLDSAPLAGPFQAGAWESLGLGWLVASWVEAPPDSREEPARTAPTGVPARLFDQTGVMVEAYRAVETLRQDDPGLWKTVRSATRSFGGKAQFSGLEAAFAFELAKARPANPKPNRDARAHRWLLGALLNRGPGIPDRQGPAASLLDWLKTDPFAPGTLAGDRKLILTRWLWLARYLDLPAPAVPQETLE